MVKINFIIETSKLRQPKSAIKIIEKYIRLVCGECYIEAPTGYLTKNRQS